MSSFPFPIGPGATVLTGGAAEQYIIDNPKTPQADNGMWVPYMGAWVYVTADGQWSNGMSGPYPPYG